jgi:hypothetical protein
MPVTTDTLKSALSGRNFNRGLTYRTIYWLNKTANIYFLSTQKSEICPLEKSRGDDSAGHYEERNV